MTSPFYRPTNPFANTPSASGPTVFSGSKELSYAGLAAAAEGGDGALSAQHVAQSAAMKASGEAVSLAKSMSLAQGTIGNAAILHPAVSHAAAAAAASEVSPLVQLIMKLPGALGLTSSFFEWLQHLFAPGAHDLLSTLESGLHLDLAGHAAALEHVGDLAQAGEHFTVSMSSLPGDAPILSGLKEAGIKASGHLLTGTPADHFLQDPANLGAGPDLSNAQFEHAVPACDGALAGPGLSQTGGNMVLSGNQRLFSDNASGGQFSSLVSNTATPASSAGSGSLSTSGLSMPQPQPAYQPSESTGGITEAKGSLLTGKAAAAPAFAYGDGLLTGKSGSLLTGKSDSLIASDVPSYTPSSGGHFLSGAAAPAAEAPLRAKPLSFADLRKGSEGLSHRVRALHNSPAAHAHAEPSLPNLSQHRLLAANPSAEQLASPSAAHPVPNVADEVHHHSALPAHSLNSHLHPTHKPAMRFSKSLSNALRHQDQLKVAGLGNKASQYSVQQGDSLWTIARSKLGEGTRWQDLYHSNFDVLGKNPDLIFSGTHLRLPDLASQAGKYIVKPGDSLWTIAKNQLGDGSRWGEIYHANAALIGESPRLIVPGQQLSLPAAGPSMAQAAPSSAVPLAAAHAPADAAVAGESGGMASAASEHALAAVTGGGGRAISTTSGAARLSAAPSGAAAAATLNHAHGNLVSSRLAPDLSFLSKKPD